jgi:predicted amidohydrolase
VKVGTVYLRPRNSTVEKNMVLWCEQIDAAGKLGLDIVCLGEAILVVGTGKSHADVAEPIPGPQTQRLAEAARRNRIWVVAGLVERDGEAMYNTAVLLDRDGKLAGKYRKVHLPREEWIKGITPGDAYPVFQTDFGTIAIQICYDWFFPEAAELFALKGAEIIFAPTWGNTKPDAEGRAEGETVFRVRARDNGVYMVPSVYDGNSMVIDPLGRILTSSDGREGVFWAEVDLNAREPLEWVGHWRSIGPRHRMPDTYGPLTEEPQGPSGN